MIKNILKNSFVLALLGVQNGLMKTLHHIFSIGELNTITMVEKEINERAEKKDVLAVPWEYIGSKALKLRIDRFMKENGWLMERENLKQVFKRPEEPKKPAYLLVPILSWQENASIFDFIVKLQELE